MLRNALFSLLILLMGKSYAQQSFFVLIQAENSQPFYVKMDDKSLSSNAKGRLILSQLKSGSQHIAIGFPKQSSPERQYTFNIDGKDLEFQLKDLGEKGWGLFNPQTSELKTADQAPPVSTRNEGIKKDDAFSRLMAGVVGDTAVMYNTYAMEEALKDSAVVKTDSARGESAVPPAPMVLAPPKDSVTAGAVPPLPSTNIGHLSGSAHSTRPARPPLSSTAYAAGTIDKLSERKTPKGLRIAFADRPVGKKADTVIIIIPPDTVAAGEIALNTADSSKGRQVPSDPTGVLAGSAIAQPDSTGAKPGSERMQPGSTGMQPGSERTQPGSTGALFRSKPDSSQSVGARPDSAVAMATETVVRSNPDTIHVYIGPAKKGGQGKTDSMAAGQGVVDRKGEVDHKGEADRKEEAGHKGEVERKGEVDHKGEADHKLARSKPDSAQKSVSPRLVVVNSDCRNFASDYDVDKLRVKMLEGSKDEDRIQTARKIFKSKCFTTKQIRALSEVFTTDAGKYRFFESAYPFVSDDRFRELTDLLADPVYNSKFRAMTGQQ